MKIFEYLVCILPLIIITNAEEICDSNYPEYDSCLANAEGFSADWFKHNIPTWKKHLAKYVNKPNLKFLEIGTYEGKSALWLFENVLTHPTSNLTCIDPWNEWGNDKGETIFARFKNNLKKYLEKINIVRDYSYIALRKYEPVPTFDLIYIDGCHTAACAYIDIILSFPLLKPGGIVIFDDYWWEMSRPDHDRPQLAVDTFRKIFASKIDVLHIGYQVIVKKKEEKK